MKEIALTLCLFAFSAGTKAQKSKFEWAKSVGSNYNDGVNAISADAQGNVCATGCFGGSMDFDPGAGTFYMTPSRSDAIYILKLDPGGNFVWARNMGGGSLCCAASIAMDLSGNVYTTGWFSDTVDFDPGPGVFKLVAGSVDIFLSKLDASGNFVWAQRIGGDTLGAYGNSIAVDAGGNVYTTGYFYDSADFDPGPSGIYTLTAAGNRSTFILKLTTDGDFVWAKKIGEKGSYARGQSLATDESGNVYTLGELLGKADFDPGPGAFQLADSNNISLFLLKLGPAGNFVWAKKMSSDWNGVFGKSIALDGSGIYTSGYFRGTADFDPGPDTFHLTTNKKSFTEIFVSKLDVDGNFEWAKRVGTDSLFPGTRGNSIAVDPSGVYTTGYFIGTSDFDPGAGKFNLTSKGREDIFLLKLDLNGDFVWAKAMGGKEPDAGASVATDSSGNVYSAGYFADTVDFDPDPSGNLYLKTVSYRDLYIHKMGKTSLGMRESKPNGRLFIYPNPTTGLLNTEVRGYAAGEIGIRVLSSTGQVVMEQSLNAGHSTLNIRPLPSGLYFLQFVRGDIILDWQKVMKI